MSTPILAALAAVVGAAMLFSGWRARRGRDWSAVIVRCAFGLVAVSYAGYLAYSIASFGGRITVEGRIARVEVIGRPPVNEGENRGPNAVRTSILTEFGAFDLAGSLGDVGDHLCVELVLDRFTGAYRAERVRRDVSSCTAASGAGVRGAATPR